MFALEITESAESDLDQITDYLSFELCNPQAAAAFLDEVERVSDVLADTPELFPLCSDSKLAELGYRKAIVRAYILVYEIDADAEVVRILRFFHESENYANKL
jgi:plasmid stabilization system protein ParE